MKQITLILFIIISFSFQSNKSYPNNAQNDINLICSGKWHLEYMKVAGNKIPLPAEMIENTWVIFHSDGTTEGMNQEGELTKGKWEYFKEIRSIKGTTTDEEETHIQKIISISESKFVVSAIQHEHEYITGFTKR